MLVAAAVEDLALSTPPESPATGSCYLVGPSPTGDWAGHAQELAAYTTGGWRFIAPRDGMTAMIRSSGSVAAYRNGVWEIGALRGSEVAIDGQKVIGAQGAAVAAPTGGTIVDVEARTAVGEILAAMRAHGLIAT